LSYFFFFIVFQIFLYINTILLLIGIFYLVVFGLIPFFLPNKKNAPVNNSELVSIIIPVYNDGFILEKHLEKLLKLDYPNYEILIVYSEKSTDRTEEIALKYAQNYNNVRALPERISKGHALNIGIDNAKAEYLLFLDSDSLVLNGFIEEALSYFADKDMVLVNGCPIGLNATQNLTTQLSWSVTNFISYVGVGSNRLFKHVGFQGFGGIWRKSALIECGKFREDTSTEDSELNIRINRKYSKWKGVFGANLYCYYYYPTDFTTFYLQLKRWNLGNLSYMGSVIKGIFQISGVGARQKFIYLSQFLMTFLFPIITYFSLGMSVVQFFLNFFYPNLSFGGGLFFLLIGLVSMVITFITMFLFTYPKYRRNSKVKLSKKYIFVGIFGIIYVIGLVFGIASLNSFKDMITKRHSIEVFYKVDKTKVQLSTIS